MSEAKTLGEALAEFQFHWRNLWREIGTALGMPRAVEWTAVMLARIARLLNP